jgi:2',3'-cyclic-nucleotide 2'-phosphodiesterase (5'-nucleotidase family)
MPDTTVIAAWSFGIMAVACAVACNQPHGADVAPPTSRTDVARPMILATADVAGWIVPCGCTTNQSGGLPRRGRLVADMRGKGEVLVVDAGGAAAGTTRYDRLRFEAILRGEMATGLVAHNIGASEAALGGEELRRLADALAVPFVSANLHDENGPLAPACRTVKTKDGRTIAFIGVVSPSLVATASVQASPPHEAVLATLHSLTPRPDYVVVLAYLPEDELVSFAMLVPEIDLVIGGPTGQSMPPKTLGPTTVMSVTNKGKFVARVRLPPGRGNPEADVVELGEAYADDPRQVENVKSLRAELARLDIAAHDTSFMPKSLVGRSEPRPMVAGTDACRSCHTADTEVWNASAHAHAWQTIVSTGAHVDAACQHCHTTGFGRPGGFESVLRSPNRVDVGCESCHGPSAAHAADPTVLSGFGTAAKDQCISCHDQENSPHFDFDDYWSQIIHGRASPGDTSPRGE